MSSLEEQIQELEAELTKTPYNKATSKHIGRIKAKIARLRDEAVNRAMKSSGGGEGYSVKKSGDATAVLVGFPSTGKSTLLNKLTGTASAVAAYEFTTLTVVPGALEHKGAKIQLLDMPGLIAGAAMGKGRGKEVIGCRPWCGYHHYSRRRVQRAAFRCAHKRTLRCRDTDQCQKTGYHYQESPRMAVSVSMLSVR